jgi:hypothetical protein
MTVPRAIAAGILILALALPAAAQTGDSAPARPAAPAASSSAPAKTTATGDRSRPATAAAPRATSADRSRSNRAPGSRRLEDIHIEGEIPVPQVLFITARDQRRMLDFQHRRYLRTSRQVGEQTVFPSRIVLARSPSTGKETSP